MAAGAESDVCSDLDDDEAEKAELTTDQLNNQDPIDHTNPSDHEEIEDGDAKKNLVSQGCKRSLAVRRALDSDDEDEEMEPFDKDTCKADATASKHSNNIMHSNPTKLRENFTDCCRDKLKNEGGRRMSVIGDLEEASMPPLMLNESMESADSSDSSIADEPPRDFDPVVPSDSMATSIVNKDSQHGEDNQPAATQPVVEEEEEERVGVGGDPDNSSLELSLLWQPSMPPPAQVRKDSSDEILPGGKVGCDYSSVLYGKGCHVSLCVRHPLPDFACCTTTYTKIEPRLQIMHTLSFAEV